MKKIMYMAVAAIAVLSSCSSEELTQGNNGISGDAKVFTGVIDNGDVTSRTAYSYDSSTKVGKVSWSSDDKVSINGAVYSVAPDGTDATKATFTYVSGTAPTAAPYTAFYADGANGGTYYDGTTITLPSSYTYDATNPFNMPMYAHNESDTKLSFQNICGVMAIKVTSTQIASIKKIIVTSDKAISGTCSILENSGKYTATATGTADTDKRVTLNCETAVTLNETGTTFYLPVPAGSHTLTVAVLNGDGTTAKSMTTSAAVNIERNTVYNITFKASNLLPGKFTVANGKTVRFTRGNLYWNNSESAYHLEANQYDSPNSTSGNTDTYSTSHVAHFYYSANEDVSRAETYLEKSGYPTTSDVFWCNVSNKITVDGTSDLYVLTKDEWSYLIGSTSPRSKNLRKDNVTVAGKSCCLVIAPDGYTGTIAGSYSAEEWATAEATYGLVCLPAAGYWGGSSFYNGGTDGHYWSATPYYFGSENYASLLYFTSGNVYMADYGRTRATGRSVRLVK